MVARHAYFARTTSWLYKALHLALIVSAQSTRSTDLSVLSALMVIAGVLTGICVFPSMVHPVRDRRDTNALFVQGLLVLACTHAGLYWLCRHGHTSSAAVGVQLMLGHVFYSFSSACLKDKHIMIGAPLVAIVFAAAALCFPIVASLAGPRAPEAHGLSLVVALGVGELVGVMVFVAAQLVHALGGVYESIIRSLCE